MDKGYPRCNIKKKKILKANEVSYSGYSSLFIVFAVIDILCVC